MAFKKGISENLMGSSKGSVSATTKLIRELITINITLTDTKEEE